jgi:hypothetical protein
MHILFRKLEPAKNYGQALVILVLAMIGSAGCAGHRQAVALDPVGPSPARQTPMAPTNGSLVVYSACGEIPDLDAENSGNASDNSSHWEYSDYEILAPDGKPIKFVGNNTGVTLIHPQQVELPAGRYVVVARANGVGRVTVPIVIASGQITTLHLDDGGFWPSEPGFNQTNTVHLPNGNIVGWRAFAATDADNNK